MACNSRRRLRNRAVPGFQGQETRTPQSVRRLRCAAPYVDMPERRIERSQPAFAVLYCALPSLCHADDQSERTVASLALLAATPGRIAAPSGAATAEVIQTRQRDWSPARPPDFQNEMRFQVAPAYQARFSPWADDRTSFLYTPFRASRRSILLDLPARTRTCHSPGQTGRRGLFNPPRIAMPKASVR